MHIMNDLFLDGWEQGVAWGDSQKMWKLDWADALELERTRLDERVVKLLEVRMNQNHEAIEIIDEIDLQWIRDTMGEPYCIGAFVNGPLNYIKKIFTIRCKMNGRIRLIFGPLETQSPLGLGESFTEKEKREIERWGRGTMLGGEVISLCCLTYLIEAGDYPHTFSKADIAGSFNIEGMELIDNLMGTRMTTAPDGLLWSIPNLGMTDTEDFSEAWLGKIWNKSDALSDTMGGQPAQVGGEPINVPTYKDTRLPIKMIGKNGSRRTGFGDGYYINQHRCTECGQRVIVSLSKEECPPPTLSMKCPTCKKQGLVIE